MLGLMAFVFRYTGFFRWLTADRFGLICAPALPLLLLAWTDPWHNLYWTKLEIGSIGGSSIAIRSFGPGFWAMCAYCYALVALSTLLLIQAAFRSTGLYRVQAAVMLFGVLLPWVVEIIDLLRLCRFIPVDLVSMTFAVTGLSFLPALFRFHLLDLPPVAWAMVVKRMDDAVVVIDPWGRIVNLNPAAERLIGKKSHEVTGVEAARAFSEWSALADRLGRVERHEESFELDGPDSAPGLARSMCGSRRWATTCVASAGCWSCATSPGSSALTRSGFECSASRRPAPRPRRQTGPRTASWPR